MRISRKRKIAHGRGFDPHLGHSIRYALVTQWSECGSYENLPVHDVVLLLGSAVWKRVIPSCCHPPTCLPTHHVVLLLGTMVPCGSTLLDHIAMYLPSYARGLPLFGYLTKYKKIVEHPPDPIPHRATS